MRRRESLAAPVSGPPPQEVLLEVRNLKTHFHVMDGVVPAVDGVSFSLRRGQSLGIVGESGSGKSVTALTIMRLLDIPPAEIADGEIWFDGREILRISDEQMRDLRGDEMAMIFQEPLTSLNPVFTVGHQIAEQVQQHRRVSRKEATDRAIESLRVVGIPSPERRVKQYPHEMSGGMRQRVMIAMALSCEPKLLIADEPTTALDVTIQAQILDLLRELVADEDAALILITHDLGVVAGMCERVHVMYAGTIAEAATAEQVFAHPRHPYTLGLLQSVPRLDAGRLQKLRPIEGQPPNMLAELRACPYAPRCPNRIDVCTQERPLLDDKGGGQLAACFNPAARDAWQRTRLGGEAA